MYHSSKRFHTRMQKINGEEDYDGSGDGSTNCYHQDYYCNPTAENLIHRVVNTAITKVSDCSDECNKYDMKMI